MTGIKKVVNGKMVNIPNIETFIEAMRCANMDVSCQNTVSKISDIDRETVDKYITQYRTIYGKFPFPLSIIENNSKYAVIIKHMRKAIDKKIEAYIKNGLHIVLDDKHELVFIRNNWGIQERPETVKDNTELSQYKHEISYKEFEWIDNALDKKVSTFQYYSTYMKEFMVACENKPEIIMKEMNKILQIDYVPHRLKLKSGYIVGTDGEGKYLLSVYLAGKVPNGNQRLYFTEEDDTGLVDENTPVYNYSLFKQGIIEDQTMPSEQYFGKLELCTGSEREPFDNVFETILRENVMDDNVDSADMRGIILNDNIIYEVNNSVYVCKRTGSQGSLKLFDGGEIYSADKKTDTLYVMKKVTEDNLIEERIYSTKASDPKVFKLCSIGYRERG